MKGIYLYGIVGFPPALMDEICGLGDAPVFLVPHGGLAAVVGPSPLAPWPPDEFHLTLHEAVVEKVMGSRPILPVRFNTLFRSGEAVIALLDKESQPFRSALDRVAGKVELGLRVLWEPPGNAEALVDQEAGEGGPGTEYLYRRLRDQRRQASLRAAGEQVAQKVQARFRSLAVENWMRRLPTDRLLLSGAYLVERDRVDAFREGVAKAREEFSSLSFLLTGPWPPYHFVNGAHDEPGDALGT
jgi:hypothetical protein